MKRFARCEIPLYSRNSSITREWGRKYGIGNRKVGVFHSICCPLSEKRPRIISEFHLTGTEGRSTVAKRSPGDPEPKNSESEE